MCEVNLLPQEWVAAQREIEQRESQLAILSETLERMLAAGAADAVIEGIIAAIDAVDAEDTDDETQRDDNPDREARREIITQLRSEGYVGVGFDALVTLYHRDLAELEYIKAENETRGHMIRTRYQANYSARKLWFCTDRELRKYASEEMLEWFDQYGRLTRAQLRENLLGRKHYAGSGYYNA